MIIRFFETMYFKLKKPEISIDVRVSSMTLVFVIIRSFVSLVRGSLRCYKWVLIGRGVRITSRRQLTIGRGSVIGQYTVLNATGINGIQLGKSSSIADFCILKVSGSMLDIGFGIRIEDGVGIGEFSHIGGAGGVVIGKNTIIGPYFSCHLENHVFTKENVLYRDQGVERKGIDVGKNC